jgi:hypothetical protein
MGLKKYLLCFFMVLLVATVVCRVYAGNDVVADKPPVDIVARAMLPAAPAEYKEEFRQLADMLGEVPAEIPVGETAVVTRRMDNVMLMLKVIHNEVEGKAWGWDFYWYKYWCQGDFEARMPNAIGIRVNEQGEITFFYNALWFNDVKVIGEVKVTREEAVNKALEITSSDMEWIGVTGIKSISATPVLTNEEDTWPKPGTYYPAWSVEINYDKHYMTPEGAWAITGYVVCIWANTGEVLYHSEQGVYAPLPEEYQPKEEAQSENLLPEQDTTAIEAQLPIGPIIATIALAVILPLTVGYHKGLLRKLHMQRLEKGTKHINPLFLYKQQKDAYIEVEYCQDNL